MAAIEIATKEDLDRIEEVVQKMRDDNEILTKLIKENLLEKRPPKHKPFLVKTDEAMKLLGGISTFTLRKLIKSKKLTPVRLGSEQGQKWFNVEEIRKLSQSGLNSR